MDITSRIPPALNAVQIVLSALPMLAHALHAMMVLFSMGQLVPVVMELFLTVLLVQHVVPIALFVQHPPLLAHHVLRDSCLTELHVSVQPKLISMVRVAWHVQEVVATALMLKHAQHVEMDFLSMVRLVSVVMEHILMEPIVYHAVQIAPFVQQIPELVLHAHQDFN